MGKYSNLSNAAAKRAASGREDRLFFASRGDSAWL
jgi:hypothetical protein